MKKLILVMVLLSGAARADDDEGTAWADHKWVRVLYSGVMCHAQAEKDWAVKVIRLEQKYAKKYGQVVDMDRLYEMQTFIRWMDERLKDAKGELSKRKLSKLPCSGYVKTLAMCFSLKDPNSTFKTPIAACEDAQMKAYVDAPLLAGMDQ